MSNFRKGFMMDLLLQERPTIKFCGEINCQIFDVFDFAVPCIAGGEFHREGTAAGCHLPCKILTLLARTSPFLPNLH